MTNDLRWNLPHGESNVVTWASMSRAMSQRASQKPSRPASKATVMRVILCPAFSASSRHRCNSFRETCATAGPTPITRANKRTSPACPRSRSP